MKKIKRNPKSNALRPAIVINPSFMHGPSLIEVLVVFVVGVRVTVTAVQAVRRMDIKRLIRSSRVGESKTSWRGCYGVDSR